MKSIIVDCFGDAALDDRLQVALDLVRAHDAHLTCHYTVPFPLVPSYEPFGGVANMAPIINALHQQELEARQAMDARLGAEDVRWDWFSRNGDNSSCLVEASGLADLMVISQSKPNGQTPGFIDFIVTHSACPVLLVPEGCQKIDPFAPVVIGWNGSAQIARTLRQALPMLRLARQVYLVSIGEDADPLPLEEAGAYLSRHGVKPQLQSVNAGHGGAPERLRSLARETGASAIIMGAYGHSRLRETILGGTTRALTRNSEIPLILGH